MTEHLLEHDTNINKVNKAGCTALHVAVNKQHIHCTTILLKHKCDVNIQVNMSISNMYIVLLYY